MTDLPWSTSARFDLLPSWCLHLTLLHLGKLLASSRKRSISG